MTDLTLVEIDEGCEIYLDNDFRRYRRYKSGAWTYSEGRRLTGSLDDLRDQELTRIYESKMLAGLPSAINLLKHSLLHHQIADLIRVIAEYLMAIYPGSLPVPSDDFYRKHKPELATFRRLVIYPGKNEYWVTDKNDAMYNFSGVGWYAVTSGDLNDLNKLHPIKHPFLFDTRRKQVLGLPWR